MLKMLIKDQFAIQIGASQLPWSKKVTRLPQPPVRASRLSWPNAAGVCRRCSLLNASYGHGFEYDDFFGNAHPGCAVVSAAFAIAEELDKNLKDTISALVVGYETYVRIGKWGSPAVLNVGWQPHAIFANFWHGVGASGQDEQDQL